MAKKVKVINAISESKCTQPQQRLKVCLCQSQYRLKGAGRILCNTGGVLHGKNRV